MRISVGLSFWRFPVRRIYRKAKTAENLYDRNDVLCEPDKVRSIISVAGQSVSVDGYLSGMQKVYLHYACIDTALRDVV